MADTKGATIGQILYRYKAHHVLFWLLYFVFCLYIYRGFHKTFASLILSIIIYFIFIAGAFYITAYSLLPKYLYTRRYGAFFALFIGLLLILSVGLTTSLYLAFNDTIPDFGANLSKSFFMSLVTLGTMVAMMSAAKLVVERIQAEQITKELKRERVETELQYLKAQVNPHFLFNAINSVYFLIKKDPEQAAETLIKLSDLLRFQLYDCSDEKIAIEKEIEYVKNFIALEKIRKGEKVNVTFNMEGHLNGFEIAPFLLIPFLENSFKHVSNFSNGGNNIEIRLQQNKNVFSANFMNTTDNVVRNNVGGIGLKNVKRRLELIYPGKHQLIIDDKPGSYSVNLSLQLT